MNILHVYKVYHPEDGYSGVPSVIRTLTRFNGGTVFALGKDAGTHTFSNATVHISKRDFTLRSTSFSRVAIKEFKVLAAKADLIHFHYPWPYGDLLYLLSRSKKPAICSYHSDIVKQKILGRAYAPLRNCFLGRMRAIIPATPTYAATSPVLQKFKDKVRVIPYGLDEQEYPKPDLALQATWQAKVGQGFFLFLGVLRYYKGLDTLLEAVVGTNLSVVIAGDGPQRDHLHAKAKTLGLDKNIIFVGRVSDADKVALLNLCRAFVFPSHVRSEAFGLSLVEAAMYAKPAIACEIGSGMSYVVEHGVTGLLVPPNKPIALRNAMLQLNMHADECLQMGKRARARYETLFQAAGMAKAYADLYAQILSR